MTAGDEHTQVVSLLEERVRLDKHTVETGRVAVRIATQERLIDVADELLSESVSVERVSINTYLDEAPATREEAGVTIVPVVEEVMVKRFLLKEEVHITRTRRLDPFSQSVALKAQDVIVERTGLERSSTPEQDVSS